MQLSSSVVTDSLLTHAQRTDSEGHSERTDIMDSSVQWNSVQKHRAKRTHAYMRTVHTQQTGCCGHGGAGVRLVLPLVPLVWKVVRAHSGSPAGWNPLSSGNSPSLLHRSPEQRKPLHRLSNPPSLPLYISLVFYQNRPWRSNLWFSFTVTGPGEAATVRVW